MTGSFGNTSIISFGKNKILDCGGGGAILTNNQKLYEKVKIAYKKISKRPKNYKKLYNHYKNVYYSLKKLIDKDDKFWKLMYETQFFF